ncbi:MULTISPECIES: hypothetical protein [Luteibacter]|jgi:hypothetical protein|uniref:hypothetical protein n=1 Tax=Luteibacter sp. dw_328 TaxID=2719796 RepID=UPI0007BF3F5A|nr:MULTISPECIES: hypothetical protein [Luteibacter]
MDMSRRHADGLAQARRALMARGLDDEKLSRCICKKTSGSSVLDSVTLAWSKGWRFDTSACPRGKDETTYRIVVPIIFSLGFGKTF